MSIHLRCWNSNSQPLVCEFSPRPQLLILLMMQICQIWQHILQLCSEEWILYNVYILMHELKQNSVLWRDTSILHQSNWHCCWYQHVSTNASCVSFSVGTATQLVILPPHIQSNWHCCWCLLMVPACKCKLIMCQFFCWHCHTTSHSPTPHPVKLALLLVPLNGASM